MSMTKHSQVAKRYAEALFATIVASDHAPASISEEIQQVISILEDSKVHSVFHHPKTAKKRKGELVKLMNVSPITESFLLLVVEKSREGLLPSIAYHFEQLVLEAQQTTIAEIVSAILSSRNSRKSHRETAKAHQQDSAPCDEDRSFYWRRPDHQARRQSDRWQHQPHVKTV